MPFKGLTWFRLKEHIRKTFWIYIVGIAVMLLVSNLLYTTTAPRTPAEREVLVYIVDSYSDTSSPAVEELAEEGLVHGQASDETLDLVRFESIAYQGAEDYASPMLLTARMSIGDGDIYLCSPEGFDYMCRSGMPTPLDEYLADGWLSGLNAETVEWTNPDTGETVIAGISLENLPGLYDLFRFDVDGAYLVVAVNSSNPETAMDVVEHMLYRVMETQNDAPAAESAAEETGAMEENADASADREEPAA